LVDKAKLGNEGGGGEEEFAEKRLTTTTTVSRQVVQNFQTKFFLQNSKSFLGRMFLLHSNRNYISGGAKMFGIYFNSNKKKVTLLLTL
jgi:hypothetical protein